MVNSLEFFPLLLFLFSYFVILDIVIEIVLGVALKAMIELILIYLIIFISTLIIQVRFMSA